jgi:hypothetical protein
LYTTPDLNPAEAFVGQSNFSYRNCETNEIDMIQISDEVEPLGLPSGTMICARTGSVELTSGDSGYSMESETNCCEPTPTETPSIPSLTGNFYDAYSLNNGGSFSDFSVDAPTSSAAEGVLCDILNAAPDCQFNGFGFRYYTNPIGVGTQIFGFMSPYNPIPDMIGLYSTGIILSGAPTYYVKTDNDGYITEFTLLTTCDSKVWSMDVCNNYCSGGTTQCVSPAILNLYTDLTVTDITANGVVIYTDAERTLPFDGFFTIISNGKIYDVSSGIIGTEYTINGPC